MDDPPLARRVRFSVEGPVDEDSSSHASYDNPVYQQDQHDVDAAAVVLDVAGSDDARPEGDAEGDGASGDGASVAPPESLADSETPPNVEGLLKYGTVGHRTSRKSSAAGQPQQPTRQQRKSSAHASGRRSSAHAGGASAIAHDDEEEDATLVSRLNAWAAEHPWTLRALLVLLAVGLCCAAVLPTVCLTLGCPPRQQQPQDEPLALRVLVRFTDPGVGAKQLLPLLAPFFNSTRLASSGVELLDFQGLEVLREAKAFLQQRYPELLDLLLNDYPVAGGPQFEDPTRGGALVAPSAANAPSPPQSLAAELLPRPRPPPPPARTPGASGSSPGGAPAGAPAAAGGGDDVAAAPPPMEEYWAPWVAAPSPAAEGAARSPGSGAGSLWGRRMAQQEQQQHQEQQQQHQEHQEQHHEQDQDRQKGEGASRRRAQQQAGAAADPLVSEQWHLENIRAAEAWAITQGLPDVVVAVLDTGTDLAHPDLLPNLWTNAGEVPGDGLDNDGNGFVDDVNGYDFAGPCSSDWRSSSSSSSSRPSSSSGAASAPSSTTTDPSPTSSPRRSRAPPPPPPSRTAGRRRSLLHALPFVSLLQPSHTQPPHTHSGATHPQHNTQDGHLTHTRQRQRSLLQRVAPAGEPDSTGSSSSSSAAGSGDGAQGPTAVALALEGGGGLDPDQLFRPGRCGSDPDPNPDSPNDGHGTHVAGIVAAARGNGVGGAGVAPRVRIMVLKVSDPAGNLWTSNIMRAFDYALRMGAHVVSCSFGPVRPNTQPTAAEAAQGANEVRLYQRAVQPLATKGVLLVAAAGNEDTDLDRLRAVGMPYLPCSLDLPNVLCVAATDASNRPWREVISNVWVGTNTGPTTVHLAAPGWAISSTLPGGGYGVKSGSSMAAPLVSGAAALVLSVLGARSGDFFQADRARSLLLQTGNPQPGLPVSSQRTLNVGRAVQAAAAQADSGGILLLPLSFDVAAVSGVLIRGLADAYYALPPASAAPAAGGVPLLGLRPFDTSVRPASTRLAGFKHAGERIAVAVRGHLRLPAGGSYGVRVAAAGVAAGGGGSTAGGGAAAAAALVREGRLAVTVGQRVLEWSGEGEVVLFAPQAGWYGFEVLLVNPSGSVDLTWSLPSAPRTFGPLPDGYLMVGSTSTPPPIAHEPQALPALPGAAPGGFQVLWSALDGAAASPAADQDSQYAGVGGAGGGEGGVAGGSSAAGSPGAGSGAGSAVPRVSASFLVTALAGGVLGAAAGGGDAVQSQQQPHFSYSSFLDELDLVTPGSLSSALAGGAAGSSAEAAAGMAAAAVGALYGTAISRIRPRGGSGPGGASLQLRVACSFCSLHVGGMQVLDVSDAASPLTPTTSSRLSPCLTLNPNATHTLELRFATANASAASLQLQWGACDSPAAGFASLNALAAGALWLRAPAAALEAELRTPRMQCNAWPEGVAPSSPGLVPLLPQPWVSPPPFAWSLPSAQATTVPCSVPGGVCPAGDVIMMRLGDFYPELLRVPDRMHVRCWSWWAGAFPGGLLTTRFPTSVNAAVYLAGQRVFHAVDTLHGTSANRQPWAPNATSLTPAATAALHRFSQLLVVEWHSVPASARLSVLSGSTNTSIFAPSMQVAGMMAPARPS